MQQRFAPHTELFRVTREVEEWEESRSVGYTCSTRAAGRGNVPALVALQSQTVSDVSTALCFCHWWLQVVQNDNGGMRMEESVSVRRVV